MLNAITGNQILMKKSPTKKITMKPPLNRFGGGRVLERRINKSEVLDHSKDAVAQEIVDMARANISDVLEWDDQGNVKVKASKDIKDYALKSIKKIKVIPGKAGDSLEVEMHDKVAILRLIAKEQGLLDTEANVNAPSVVGITMHGPDVVEGTIDEIDEKTANKSYGGTDPD